MTKEEVEKRKRELNKTLIENKRIVGNFCRIAKIRISYGECCGNCGFLCKFEV